ncbi:adenosylcobinamide-GDP ribazoletransferase [Thiorhodovibrio frisius]|uniref:Adenosylcobinamide-GDP ribazoletransferase n=1 Tax=Thiorhodovibrio frisius TaxID=631362 RepID=H8Z3X0_9GAMM|nr:adenosylcobinamide-GDP ribazoletransferase [Thiorhodovibrio frisius]EIC21122.1 cobalamin-5-phosphate synthase [Thiorhodovibrio frisius]WPL22182.1 Cobalamin synthase [Thiorhodovibrio frisius]
MMPQLSTQIRLAPWWRAFVVATRFLTRIPLPEVPGGGEWQAADSARAALLYPLVGLLVGAILWLVVWLLGAAPAPVVATLVLIAWVWGTGALHLDGLADCADAWVGGLGDRARTLLILKDPHLGAMGAVALLLALLAKWSALFVLASRLDSATIGLLPISAALLLIPALARAQILLLALVTPPATETGMGAALRACLPLAAARAVVAAWWLLAGLLLGWSVLGWLALAGLLLWLWRASMRQRLGGFTGDTAGALVEMTEVGLVLLVAARLG